MANRPSDFDITTPTGASSPRSGDDELRKIKQYTQNGWNDMTQETGVGVEHTNLYGTTITADTQFVGNLNGSLVNARNIELVGDVTGSVSFNASADVEMTTTLDTDTVDTNQLVDDAVTTAKIADDAVTEAQIELGGDGHWDFAVGDDNNLDIRFNGTVVFSLSSSGAIIASGDITANGNP